MISIYYTPGVISQREKSYREAVFLQAVWPVVRAEGSTKTLRKMQESRMGEGEEEMSITKYRTRGFQSGASEIRTVVVEKETAERVYPGLYTQWEAKKAEDHTYHDTWQAAHEYLLKVLTADVKHARDRLERYERMLETARRFTPENSAQEWPVIVQGELRL